MKNDVHYNKLIEKARNRVTPNEYYEKHHIHPRSLGGSDNADNIVNLTLREHFVAHLLLFRIHRVNHPRLIFAVFKIIGRRHLSLKHFRIKEWMCDARKEAASVIIRRFRFDWHKYY